MPNHISNKLEIEGTFFQVYQVVRAIVDCDGAVDFNTLIPCPAHVYARELSITEEHDFGQWNWLSWNRANWGTKWNAYASRITYRAGGVTIYFQTAWSRPYPFIIAIANRFSDLAFTYKYFHEGHNFWGVERWVCAARIWQHLSLPADFRGLCNELQGYDPVDDDIEREGDENRVF